MKANQQWNALQFGLIGLCLFWAAIDAFMGWYGWAATWLGASLLNVLMLAVRKDK